jgi:hypothetical protein
MATMKKPSWDLSREQIEAAARGLVLDRQHFGGQAARADSRSASAEIDQHIRQRMAGMTAAELLLVSAATNRGESLASAVASVAKADSSNPSTGGLIRRDVLNDYGQLHHVEFSLKPGQTKRSAWMGAYMARPEEAIAWNTHNEPLDVFESRLDQHLEEQRLMAQKARDAAAGRGVYVDLSYDYRDLEG